ncbi:MAG: nucleotide exchange factor GrpE [Microgenomates group bacterium]
MDNKKIKENKKGEIEKLRKEVEEYKNKYLRALADYQNLEKRVEQERQEIVFNASKNLLLKLLPIVDNLEKAEIFIKDDGLKMIKNNFDQFLRSEGLEEIQILGKEFDPQLAEAVEVVEGEKDNIVVEILKKGYKFNNKILRVAQVKVSKKRVEKEAKEKVKGELLKGDYL